MVRSDLGDVDPWVPFLAELRAAQTGEPVEVRLLDRVGNRQSAEAPQPTAVPAGPRLVRPVESHPIPVHRVSRPGPELHGSTQGGRVASVRFQTDGGGQAPDA